MSASRKRLFAAQGTGLPNLFGAAVPARDHAVTFADAARRARWIAIDINAEKFSLFLLSHSRKRRGLTACFDSDYPATSAETRLVNVRFGEELARRITVSTVPLWWPGADGPLSDINWAKRLTGTPAAMAAIAFPVTAERGPSGVVVFSGASIAIEADALYETHARCFALFDAVVRMGAVDQSGLPSFSKRELECLRLTAEGHTSESIAALLSLSVHTANQYLGNAVQKLNAVNRMHAVAKALRLGLID
ncbi:MAG TPA: helix-turn-helix transcriptional regulator [Rhizobiaceae bacterium]|nr:helix-turn-helix transcriptional regulator [Rhizobiaceae bacterium]